MNEDIKLTLEMIRREAPDAGLYRIFLDTKEVCVFSEERNEYWVIDESGLIIMHAKDWEMVLLCSDSHSRTNPIWMYQDLELGKLQLKYDVLKKRDEPVEIATSKLINPKCPVCKGRVFNLQSFCGCCGQRLKWRW